MASKQENNFNLKNNEKHQSFGANAFSLLNMKLAYFIDEFVLEKHYYAAMRKTHPDCFSQSHAIEKTLINQISGQINDAYRKLKKPLLRAQEIMRIKGLVERNMANDAVLFELMEQFENVENRGISELQELLNHFTEDIKLYENQFEKSLSENNKEGLNNAFLRLTYAFKLKHCIREKLLGTKC